MGREAGWAGREAGDNNRGMALRGLKIVLPSDSNDWASQGELSECPSIR